MIGRGQDHDNGLWPPQNVLVTDCPTARYRRSGEVNIAYQVVGEGPIDLVFIPGWVSHLEVGWDDPLLTRFLRRLASFSRLILFDKRGTGLSDRVSDHALPTLEERIDDVRAVLDAVGSERAAVVGFSEGGLMSVLFGATHPARTSALVLIGSLAKVVRDETCRWGFLPEEMEALIHLCEEHWGEPVMAEIFAPSMVHDAAYLERFARRLRMAASPGAAIGYIRMNLGVDVRAILPAIRVPTLVLHRVGDRLIGIGAGRDLAARIPGARFVALAGEDHLPWIGDIEPLVGEIEEFLTGVRRGAENDRVLATILFTDIVSSTRRASEMGDRSWRELLDAHDDIARRLVERFQGRVVKFTGDGLLATFDGPARAVRCAASVRDAVTELGIDVRAGLHTGEIEVRGADIGGIAVHIAQRICAVAGSREIVTSSTVRDLAAGSGLAFADRGVQSLRGVADEWRVFAATP